MPAAAIVTIVIAGLVVLVLAGFLITIARVLAGVDGALATVITAVGTIATRTQPVQSVVDSLNDGLDSASGGLTTLLQSKAGAAGAAALIAAVDPLAAPTGTAEPHGSRIRYQRVDPSLADTGATAVPKDEAAADAGLPRVPPAGGGGGKIVFGGRKTT